jgi:protein SCO1/2
MNSRAIGKVMALTALTSIVVTACGGDEPTLTGYERTPPPEVGGITLPNLTDGGTDFTLRADPDEVLVVYFGYLNCPDYCPTTMSDLKLARNRLDDDLAERIDVAMVTVDPDRDLELLPEYIGGFFADGIALGTADAGDLASAAAPFGAVYAISLDDETGEPLVGHTTSLYAIDDTGHLALTWPFGVTIEDLAVDLEILLDRADDA